MLPLDTQEEMTSRLAASGTTSALKVTLAVNKVVADHARPMADAMLAAAREADVVLLTPAGWIGAHVAEGLGLPSMGVYLQPLTPTGSSRRRPSPPVRWAAGATVRPRRRCAAWGRSPSGRSSISCVPSWACR
ncbi:hypothetical protein NKG94_03680 [Micromonospora sp. M12]